jgi:sodium-dependent dicarboxylate transporter 2/3/5
MAGGVIVAGLLHPDGNWGLSAPGARALAIMLGTVVLWVTQALPLSISALLGLGLLVATGASEGFPAAAIGFALDTVFFVLAATLVAQAVSNAGLVDRVARALDRRIGADSSAALRLVTIVSGLTALIMPSALARIKALLPLAQRVDSTLESPESPSRFLRAAGLTLASLGMVASLAVMTGGAMSIVAARTIAQFHAPVDWLQWLAMMLLPCAAITVVGSIYLQRAYPPEAISAEASARLRAADGSDRWSFREGIALVILAGTLAAWIAGSRSGLPLAIPAIFAAALYALPGIRLLNSASIQKQQWDEVLLIGTALLLSAAASETGALAWLAEGTFWLFPAGGSDLTIKVVTFLVAAALRQFFLMPSACLAVTLPIVIEVGTVTGANPLDLAMIATAAIGIVTLVPVQSPPSLLCLTSGIYRTRDHLRLAPVLLVATGAAFLAASLVLWPALRSLGWI